MKFAGKCVPSLRVPYVRRCPVHVIVFMTCVNATAWGPGGDVLAGVQLQLTSEVENFPGYAEAVSGPDLMEDLQKQAEVRMNNGEESLSTGFPTSAAGVKQFGWRCI